MEAEQTAASSATDPIACSGLEVVGPEATEVLSRGGTSSGDDRLGSDAGATAQEGPTAPELLYSAPPCRRKPSSTVIKDLERAIERTDEFIYGEQEKMAEIKEGTLEALEENADGEKRFGELNELVALSMSFHTSSFPCLPDNILAMRESLERAIERTEDVICGEQEQMANIEEGILGALKENADREECIGELSEGRSL